MNNRVTRWLTNYKVLLLSLVLFFVGCGLFVYTYGNHNFYSALLNQISSSIIAIGLLSIIWQVFIQRTFLKEILSELNISENLRSNGITEINDDFTQINWTPLFESVKNLDLFFAWSATWRHSNHKNLTDLSKRDVKIRLILPNPNHEDTMISLENRSKIESRKQIKDNIKESIKDFKKIFNDKAHLEIWFLKKIPLFTVYRFDEIIVLALSSHTGTRTIVPSFKFEKGKIYDFINDEIAYMTEDSEFSELQYDNRENKKSE